MSSAGPTLRDWLALAALPGLGPARLSPLLQRWREPESLAWPQGWLAALPARLAQPLRLWLDHPTNSPLEASVEAALAWQAESPRHYLLHPGQAAWPVLLDQLPDPPLVLWAKGDLSALATPAIAIVGTRKPTREGRDNAAAFARDLIARGFGVVSGMALGIDGIAQHTALQAGGATVGVLGCGVDVVYPPRHAGLYRDLLAGCGLLLSEHPADTAAHPRFFPRRNRLITGLSQGVLVVEAAEKSGSLVSARLGLEQGREVFALPGSIHNPQASGCLRLIQRGEAALVRNVDDILAELGHWTPTTAGEQLDMAPSEAATPPVTSPEASVGPHAGILAQLSDTPTPIDVLVAACGESVATLQLALLELELEGQAAQTAGGWVRRRG
ncbi:DNA-processing protein DprA [Salinicola sp. DM10]|uniref:DNA-processing protein DprA n=1 Tax=Salinicola sp. DM10 TaxID=2815721 RepID=UPI001A8E1819|nr:DNA-processing protein DprA [Salinicola sp. DM10]